MAYQDVGEVEFDEDGEEELETKLGDVFDEAVYLCSPGCRALFEVESNYWEMVRVC